MPPPLLGEVNEGFRTHSQTAEQRRCLIQSVDCMRQRLLHKYDRMVEKRRMTWENHRLFLIAKTMVAIIIAATISKHITNQNLLLHQIPLSPLSFLLFFVWSNNQGINNPANYSSRNTANEHSKPPKTKSGAAEAAPRKTQATLDRLSENEQNRSP